MIPGGYQEKKGKKLKHVYIIKLNEALGQIGFYQSVFS
jgi:hypothetical protein